VTRSALAMLFAAGVMMAACGGATPAATSTPGGGTPTGGPTATGGTGATPTPTTPVSTPGATNQPPAGNICAGFPTLDPNNPLAMPSPVPDPGLEAHFPAQIDGSDATDVESGSFAAFACLGGSQSLQQLQNTAGYDLTKLTWGQADYTVDGEDVELLAFRIPGGDANQIVATLAQLVVAAGADSTIEGVTQGTAGGKNVIIVAHDDGTQGYGYVTGDTLITVEEATTSQAEKIFAAVP
jgi:hypothetical protein